MSYVEQPGKPIFRYGRHIETFELVPSSSPTAPKPEPKKGKEKWKRHYAMFPFSWQERLRDCQAVSTYRLALYLLYEHWRNGGRRIKLANGVMAVEGVGRTVKLDSLRELERRGLVQVEWRSKKSPLVTCLLMDAIPVGR